MKHGCLLFLKLTSRVLKSLVIYFQFHLIVRMSTIGTTGCQLMGRLNFLSLEGFEEAPMRVCININTYVKTFPVLGVSHPLFIYQVSMLTIKLVHLHYSIYEFCVFLCYILFPFNLYCSLLFS